MMYLMTNLNNSRVQIGEGWFRTKVTQFQMGLLDRHGLLDRDITYLLNNLADLLKQDEGLRENDREALKACLQGFTGKRFAFYAQLLEEAGPGGIGQNMWLNFAKRLDWPYCTDVLTDMPTAALEELAQEIWGMHWNDHGSYWPVKKEFLKALGRRTDIYGHDSMPPELAFGILLEEKYEYY